MIIADMDPMPKKNREREDVLIENVQHVASYNWVDEEDPTIVIPEQGHFMDDYFAPVKIALIYTHPMVPASPATHGSVHI